MKIFIIINICLLVLYCAVSAYIISEQNKSMFLNTIITPDKIILVVFPVILCIMSQLIVLILGLNKSFIYYTFIYLLPPIINITSSMVKSNLGQKFYHKHYKEILEVCDVFLENSNLKNNNTKILVILDTDKRSLGLHRIVIRNVIENGDFSKDELRKELFHKYNLNFDIFTEN